MSGQDSGMGEADAASGFSDLSDSEFLQIEEPQEGDSGKPSCSAVYLLEPVGSNRAAKKNARTTAKRKRTLSPLQIFHLLYLSVTDLSAQMWCEQQMVYQKEYPGLLLPERTAVLNTGKSIHLARELEDHDLVPVYTTSREDSWAVKLLNLLSMIPVLQAGHRVREFPVFGVLEGIFVVGIIDQLGYTEKGELELNELKTRKAASMPSAAQKKRDHFQVCLYKYLFDTMVKGELMPEAFIHHLRLRPQQRLGQQVKQQAQGAGFTIGCFQDLLELTCLNLVHSDIPTIDNLQIEYVHQETNNLLGMEVVAYDQEGVRATVEDFIAYWKGNRNPKGVDIEDTWKCQYCPYSSICDWQMWRSGDSIEGNKQKKSR